MSDTDQCQGTTKSGEQCRRRARADSPYCASHGRNNILEHLPQGSPEARLEWLEKVRLGKVKEEKVNPVGGTIEVPTSVRDRIMAAKAAEDLRRQIDERDKNWVSRAQFEEGCASIALVTRDRLRAIPARVFGQDLELVRLLEDEIDAALDEGANELERVIRRILGDAA